MVCRIEYYINVLAALHTGVLCSYFGSFIVLGPFHSLFIFARKGEKSFQRSANIQLPVRDLAERVLFVLQVGPSIMYCGKTDPIPLVKTHTRTKHAERTIDGGPRPRWGAVRVWDGGMTGRLPYKSASDRRDMCRP